MTMKTPSVVRIGIDPVTAEAEIASAISGNAAARWRALEACRDYLRLVVRRGHRSNQAGRSATSDLVQETIIDGWRDFSKFQGRTPAQLHSWLRAILVHRSLNARRRPQPARIESGGQAGEIPGTTTSPSVAADRNASRAAVDAALSGLTDRHRTVIRLRIWDQCSFMEIGTRMGLSEDAARMLYGRALAKLRDSMRPGHDPG
jgi:RNA polymerase sigma-70 factor (ECF subfamily)